MTLQLLSLNRLGARQAARIVQINSEFDVRERFAALGLRPGRRVEIVRRFGARGPLQLRVDHTDVVVRATEAAGIDVELTA